MDRRVLKVKGCWMSTDFGSNPNRPGNGRDQVGSDRVFLGKNRRAVKALFPYLPSDAGHIANIPMMMSPGGAEISPVSTSSEADLQSMVTMSTAE
jgi:hypothetical protein